MIEIIDKGDNLFVIKIAMREVHSMDIPNLKDKLLDAIAERGIKKLVVDLSGVYMITSSGIGIFFNISHILESQLRFAAANTDVKKVLELTKVTSIIELFQTVDEAVASFK
ncbi:MAG TPA: STAS domain-containing protein [Spirochaetota bacterium]|nr:STAS domain-containing protein [Spirochaetota bacterium]HPC41713.1 STAS domain-containing protein [Spirochaetota bacterium]HPL15637.1 STAS domain-containing protein [Spirochaetota bacterium]HQF09262.1 STAS domain-containing protein [Spirochaetota bacterium]HQH98210.1 STAS domain-containing protein [Spirochaetota bacterium]